MGMGSLWIDGTRGWKGRMVVERTDLKKSIVAELVNCLLVGWVGRRLVL